MGRPIPLLTFAMNYLLTGDSTFGFKATNLLLHWVNAVLLFFLTNCIFGHLKTQNNARFSLLRPEIVSGVVVLVWAFHPMQLSTVMYVVQRMTILATTFSLGALLCYSVLRSRSTVKGSAMMFVQALIVPILGILALLSKESAVLLVFYLILIEIIIFKFVVQGEWLRRIFVGVFFCTLVLPVVVGLAYFIAQADDILQGYQYRDFTLIERLLTEPGVILFYLKIFFIPLPSAMSIYHDGYPVVTSPDLSFFIAIGCIVSMALLAVAARKSFVLVTFGIGIFLCSHILESTVFPLEMVFEHRNYFAIWGLALPVVWLLVQLTHSVVTSRVKTSLFTSVCVCAFIGICWQTNVRAVEWSSSLSIHEAAVEHQPHSRRARQALAVTLAKQGDLHAAITHYEYLKNNFADNAFATLALIQAKCIHGEFDETEFDQALQQLAKATITVNVASVLNDLITNHQSGHCVKPGFTELRRLYGATADSPKNRLPAYAQAIFWANFAGIEYFSGDLSTAVSYLKIAKGFSPKNVELLQRLASLQMRIDDWVGAAHTVAEFKLINNSVFGIHDDDVHELESRLESANQKAAGLNAE